MEAITHRTACCEARPMWGAGIAAGELRLSDLLTKKQVKKRTSEAGTVEVKRQRC